MHATTGQPGVVPVLGSRAAGADRRPPRDPREELGEWPSAPQVPGDALPLAPTQVSRRRPLVCWQTWTSGRAQRLPYRFPEMIMIMS